MAPQKLRFKWKPDIIDDEGVESLSPLAPLGPQHVQPDGLTSQQLCALSYCLVNRAEDLFLRRIVWAKDLGNLLLNWIGQGHADGTGSNVALEKISCRRFAGALLTCYCNDHFNKWGTHSRPPHALHDCQIEKEENQPLARVRFMRNLLGLPQRTCRSWLSLTTHRDLLAMRQPSIQLHTDRHPIWLVRPHLGCSVGWCA